MKKTTIKVSWDNLQLLKKIALDLTNKRGEFISQDQALRYILGVYEKNLK
jgi:hypothetical protein